MSDTRKFDEQGCESEAVQPAPYKSLGPRPPWAAGCARTVRSPCAKSSARAEVRLGRQPLSRHLKDRIVAHAGGAVAVLVAGGDHQHHFRSPASHLACVM